MATILNSDLFLISRQVLQAKQEELKQNVSRNKPNIAELITKDQKKKKREGGGGGGNLVSWVHTLQILLLMLSGITTQNCFR